MSTLIWIGVGFVVGIMLPAPYQDPIKSTLVGWWNKIKGNK